MQTQTPVQVAWPGCIGYVTVKRMRASALANDPGFAKALPAIEETDL
ncbi:MAG: hypothetical protein AAFO79_02555 [Pseudomonadota bacterium]